MTMPAVDIYVYIREPVQRNDEFIRFVKNTWNSWAESYFRYSDENILCDEKMSEHFILLKLDFVS